MRDSPLSDDANRTTPSWWPIGITILAILVVPLALYSLAPSGPLREGDTIFSDGQQHVVQALRPPSLTAAHETTCLLDPGAPLIIVQRPSDRQDGTILALVQGNPASAWPFCLPQTEVVLKPHQIVQKTEPLEEIRKRLAGLMGR
ncbi:MAG: hypothetical protein RI101_13910 [Nitrospira sp.]|jgi:hypothetical protein|nr:hypothetical protein [Nitrospira sp.]